MITVQRIDEICSCGVCHARNYRANRKHREVGEYKEELLGIRFGDAHTIVLCRDCAAELTAVLGAIDTGGSQ